ncbi:MULTISPECIES: hypothetical protein [unclassified Rickettsia]|uniref:hypothetical protein n=1 Tax=unclassified Rickettsia TaxID=114295 RepID=UPI0031330D19
MTSKIRAMQQRLRSLAMTIPVAMQQGSPQLGTTSGTFVSIATMFPCADLSEFTTPSY